MKHRCVNNKKSIKVLKKVSNKVDEKSQPTTVVKGRMVRNIF